MKKYSGGLHNILYSLNVVFKRGILSASKSLLSKNTCRTCALGMGGQKGGMVNELGRFPEVCKKSLQALDSDMQGPIKEEVFEKLSIDDLSKLGPMGLEKLGRIPFPLYASGTDTHFRKLSYDEGFSIISEKLRSINPEQAFFYFSGRSSNEAGFLLQLMARLYGTNHVNNCSYYCHQASGVGINNVLGSGTATLNLSDVEDCDLFFLIGANPSANHPRLMTTLMNLRKKGTKIVVFNPLREPGLVNYKVPSHFKSLLLGSKIASEYVMPRVGGDLAILAGVCKFLIDNDTYDKQFVADYCQDFESFQISISKISWESIVKSSGVSKDKIFSIYEQYLLSEKTVFAWTMGITHHLHGVDSVQLIIYTALLRGMIGKPGAGLLPLRGHSNVQGMGTVGVTPKLKEAIFNKLTKQGFLIPSHQGLDTMGCMEASYSSSMKSAFCLGGNLYGSNPDLGFASRALNKLDLITYLNTTLNEGHIFARGKEVIIFPVCARDEEHESTTQESMFNYVRLSDGGPKRIKKVLTEVQIIAEIANRLLPNSSIDWKGMNKHNNIRKLISTCIPGLENLADIGITKKEFVIPSRVFHTPIFNTKSHKAIFDEIKLPTHIFHNAHFSLMSIRSDGQYNTVVYEGNDEGRGVSERDIILLNEADMEKHSLVNGQRVTVRSETGMMKNIKVISYEISDGAAAMYFPECNLLISRKLDQKSKTPGYKLTPIWIDVEPI